MSDFPATWLNCHLGDVVDYGKTVKAEPSEIPADAWVSRHSRELTHFCSVRVAHTENRLRHVARSGMG